MTLFINAKLILEDAIREQGYLAEDGGLIIALGTMPVPLALQDHAAKVVDCSGFFLSPGFVDIHTHGGGGHDYMDGTVEAFRKASIAHLEHGTTTILPTTLACEDETLFGVIDAFKQAREQSEGMPHLPGLHLEGPYLNPDQKGAMEERFLRLPESSHYLAILEHAQGCITRWTIAPELPGALEMADHLKQRGIVVSAGHTSATHEQMCEAFAHGITHLTHFYSAMSTITREQGERVLGVIESGYLLDGLTLEVIADGKHLPPTLLQLIYKCKDHDHICATSDSMRAAGLPEGPSILGPLKGGTVVLVEDGIAKMPDRSCFAGSVATCDRMVRILMEAVGLDLAEAVKAVSLLPARFMGFAEKTGSLEVGKQADLLVFDENISIKKIFVMGTEIRP